LFNKGPGIGLDIGSKKIKIARVKRKRNGIKVVKFGSMPTPPGVVEAGIIYDPERLGEEMAVLVKNLRLRGKRVVSAVSGQQVYTRNIVMPRMKLKELREAVLFQATTFLPIPVEDAAIDIFPLWDLEDDEGKKTEVFFVAVRRIQVENLQAACRIAGLKLAAVEIEALAINRILGRDSAGTQAYLNIGASRSYFSVFNEGVLVFHRYLPFGCSAFYQQSDLTGGMEYTGFESDDSGLEFNIQENQLELSNQDNAGLDSVGIYTGADKEGIYSEINRQEEYSEYSTGDDFDQVNNTGGYVVSGVEENYTEVFEEGDTLVANEDGNYTDLETDTKNNDILFNLEDNNTGSDEKDDEVRIDEEEYNMGAENKEESDTGSGDKQQETGLDLINLEQDNQYEYLVNEIVTEVSRSVEYYNMRNAEASLENVLLCGGGSRIRGMDRILTGRVGCNVEVADTFAHLFLSSKIKEMDEAVMQELKYDFLVALGLAAREVI